jgi:MFS superfamily sulfate permease-like transporter
LLLIGFSVTTAAVRDYANKHNYRVDIDQEMLAQGMSNISSGFFQGCSTTAACLKARSTIRLAQNRKSRTWLKPCSLS